MKLRGVELQTLEVVFRIGGGNWEVLLVEESRAWMTIWLSCFSQTHIQSHTHCDGHLHDFCTVVSVLIWAAAVAAADRDLSTSVLGLQLIWHKILNRHEAERLGKNLGLEIVAVLTLFMIIIVGIFYRTVFAHWGKTGSFLYDVYFSFVGQLHSILVQRDYLYRT